MQDIFEPLFELQDKRLNKLGDPLKALDSTIDWESFRATLSKVHAKARKNNAGAKPKDPVLMFKALVIQNLHVGNHRVVYSIL